VGCWWGDQAGEVVIELRRGWVEVFCAGWGLVLLRGRGFYAWVSPVA
jgi:hypothetical protein